MGDPNLKEMANALKELEAYAKWKESLRPIDRMNFETLIAFPTAPAVIAAMAYQTDVDDDYLKWASFELGVQGRGKELEEAFNRLREEENGCHSKDE